MGLFDLSGWSVLYFMIGCGCANEATVKEVAALQGEWEWVAVEHQGNAQTPQDILGQKWVIKGNIITGIVPGTKEHHMAFRLDTSKTPKQIDLLPLYEPYLGKATPGIYALEEGMLRVNAAGANADERPTDVSSDAMVFEKVVR